MGACSSICGRGHLTQQGSFDGVNSVNQQPGKQTGKQHHSSYSAADAPGPLLICDKEASADLSAGSSGPTTGHSSDAPPDVPHIITAAAAAAAFGSVVADPSRKMRTMQFEKLALSPLADGQADVWKLSEGPSGRPHSVMACGAPQAPNEDDRQKTTRALKLDVAAPCPDMDVLLKVVNRVFGMPVSMVALFALGKCWLANTIVMPGGPVPWTVAACPWVLLAPTPTILAVDDLTQDSRFSHQPYTKNGLRTYASSPIIASNGHRLGSLCFLDHQVHRLDAGQCRLLNNLAEVVARELERYSDLRARLQDDEALQAAYRPLAYPGQINVRDQRDLAATANSCIMVIDCRAGFEVLYISQCWELWTDGLNRDDCCGQLLPDLLHSATPPAWEQLAAEAAVGARFVVPRVRARNGGPSGAVFDISFRCGALEALDNDTLTVGIPTFVSMASSLGHIYIGRLHPVDNASTPLTPLATSCRSLNPNTHTVFQMAASVLPGIAMGQVLGRGGYGTVYHATWHDTSVVCKVQDYHLHNDVERGEAEFEIALGQELVHPNVVRTLAHGTIKLDLPNCSLLERASVNASVGNSTLGSLNDPMFMDDLDYFEGSNEQLPWGSTSRNNWPSMDMMSMLQQESVESGASLRSYPTSRATPPNRPVSFSGAALPAGASSRPASRRTSIADALALASEDMRSNGGGNGGSRDCFKDKGSIMSRLSHSQVREGSPEPPDSPPQAGGCFTKVGGGSSSGGRTGSPQHSSRDPATTDGGSGGGGSGAGHSPRSVPKEGGSGLRPRRSSHCCLKDGGGSGRTSGGSQLGSGINRVLRPSLSRVGSDAITAAERYIPGWSGFTTAADAAAATATLPTASSGAFALSKTSLASNAAASATGAAALAAALVGVTPGGASPDALVPGSTHLAQCYPVRLRSFVLLEYCDQGSLQDAIDCGWLCRARTLCAPPALGPVLRTALDIAEALRYLHSMHVIHGDLTGFNVLLRSVASDARLRGEDGLGPQAADAYGRTFTAKVADFGKSRQLPKAQEYIRTESYATVTHMPPEMLATGTLSLSCDAWAFGVLFWSMWTGSRPWVGLTHAQIVSAVIEDEAPLQWPANTPYSVRALGQRCLAHDASRRPTFEAVCAELHIMLADLKNHGDEEEEESSGGEE